VKLALCLMALAIGSSGDTLLRVVNREGMRQKGIVVAAGSYTQAHIERLARAELALKPHVNFTQLWVYGAAGGAPLPKPPHLTYEYWRGMYDAAVRSPNEIAELVSIGANAVLRVRDGVGKIHRQILVGEDPLAVEIDGDRLEVLYFAFSAARGYVSQRVDVYVRTRAPLEAEVGLKLFQKLQVFFPGLEVSIFIRNDPWFVYEPTYPFANPFVEDQHPPTAEEYPNGQTLRCGGTAGSSYCRFE